MPLFGRKSAPGVGEPRAAERPPLPEPPPTGPDGLRSMEDHLGYLLSCVEELPPFGQQLIDVVGLSIAEDVVSQISLPGFDNSAMDGYAVYAEDVESANREVPVSLPVVGEVAAGQSAAHRLPPGTAMKIMTGAPIPPGATAIVAYESTNRGADDVLVYVPSISGQHIRRRGEDIQQGRRLYTVGDVLSPRDIGLLAAIGRDQVLVRPRPRVVVISTGSELVQPGRPLNGDDQIYDSNSYLLAAACRAAGASAFRVGLVSDDPDQVRQLVSDQLVRADLIVTTGGVSQGDYDIVKAVMPELGATDFVGVAMQPGKPQGFGLIGSQRVPIIMLPGNPVSAYVSFEAFVRPVLRKLMGTQPYTRTPVRCQALHAMSSMPGRKQFARGIVRQSSDGSSQVELAGGHGSHLMGDLARANALVILDEDTDFVASGDPVDVWLLAEEG